MRILFIGGTRFSGPFAVRRLSELGHTVAVFHRGNHKSDVLPTTTVEILSEGASVDPRDRRRLREFEPQFRAFAPDIVVDMIAFTRDDAEVLVDTFRGWVRRLIVPSSEDIYRAYGRLHRTEPGPPDPTPLTEDAPLREQLSLHGESYEKRWVEDVVMSACDLPATILRFPAVYGPGDHRLYEFTKRMIDGRRAILLEEHFANWRWTHGYAEDVAESIELSVTQEAAAGRIYNVGEPEARSTIERVRDFAAAAGWGGDVRVLPAERLPPHLVENLDWRQDWTVDTSRIRNELGYREVVPYEDGLRRTVDWHRRHPPARLDEQFQFEYAAEDEVQALHP